MWLFLVRDVGVTDAYLTLDLYCVSCKELRLRSPFIFFRFVFIVNAVSRMVRWLSVILIFIIASEILVLTCVIYRNFETVSSQRYFLSLWLVAGFAEYLLQYSFYNPYYLFLYLLCADYLVLLHLWLNETFR